MIERAYLRHLTAVLVLTACAKTVPLIVDDASANDPRCPTPQHPVTDGQPCSFEGLRCEYPDTCGADTTTCMNGVWNTVRCTPGRHCPCLSQADCDVGAICTSGVCQIATAPACGGPGDACCGGFCGACAMQLSCVNGVCLSPPPSQATSRAGAASEPIDTAASQPAR